MRKIVSLLRAIFHIRPPYVPGGALPGNHCVHCTENDKAVCMLKCDAVYRQRYGVEPL